MFLVPFILFLIAGCVTSEVTVTTKNTAAGHETSFDPVGAAHNRVKLALLYLKNENMQQAKVNLEKALEYQPSSPKIHRIFAYYYEKVNEPEIAEEYYKKALSLDSKDADTYNNYGRFLCIEGRYKEAEKALLTAIAQPYYAGVANTYENAGFCAEKADDLDKAIYYYSYALSHNPHKSYLNLTLAKLNIDKKEYKRARLNLYNYSKKSKSSAESLWQWIRLSYATEKNASMNKYAGQLLSEFPKSDQALKYLNHEYN